MISPVVTFALGLVAAYSVAGQQIHDVTVGSANGSTTYTPNAIVSQVILNEFEFKLIYDYFLPSLLTLETKLCSISNRRIIPRHNHRWPTHVE